MARPASVWDDTGPSEPTTFEIEGHRFLVSPTGGSGVHTGRGRYGVECLTCDQVIHPRTTGPGHRVEQHLR